MKTAIKLTGIKIGMGSEEVKTAIEIFERGIAPLLCDFSPVNEQIFAPLCLILASRIVQLPHKIDFSVVTPADHILLGIISKNWLNNQDTGKLNNPIVKRCKIACPPGGIFFGI